MSLRKIDNPDLFRSNIKKKLLEIIENEKTVNNLEKGIFNYALKEADQRKIVKKWDNAYFVQIYLDRLRSIMSNLKGEVLESIKDGSVKAHIVAFMTHQELCPEKWSALIEAKSKRDKNKFETNISAATDTFTCRKCKGNNCTYYLLQVRSSDEPMNCYVTCIDCGQRWKTN
jgi:DNA-directed RNA polymerase subunit M/transcription elongation factor TFIIS